MKKFNEFLTEKAGKGLTIFDIDDTLFVSKARVIVVNTNTGKTKALTPMEFNSYKLRKHEAAPHRRPSPHRPPLSPRLLPSASPRGWHRPSAPRAAR